jgi:hypothetical protein
VIAAAFQESFPVPEAPAPEETPAADTPTDGATNQSEPQMSGDAPPAPAKLFRRINDIQPFYDYDPDGNPCDHMCPKGEECPSGDECPEEPEFYSTTPPGRYFAELHYQWAATNLFHHPLYFEDVQLERYGQVKCSELVQPFKSIGKFGVQLGSMPYQLIADPPASCRYVLGYYRPGDCSPLLHQSTPLNDQAGVNTSSCGLSSLFGD